MHRLRPWSIPAALLASALCLPGLPAREESARVSAKVNKTSIDFMVDGKLVTTYRYGEEQYKPYFYPMYALPGVEITESGPKDHVHHRSAWFCHGDVVPEGLELKDKIKNVKGVDFWSENKLAGRIVCVKVEEPKPAKGGISFVTKNEWRTRDGTKVLEETRTITFRNLGPNRNLIEIVADLYASDYPIEFADTKEGSMGIRIRDEVRVDRKKGGKMTNAEGKEGEKGCWGRVSDWCDYSGPVGDDKTAGLAVFADPKNEIDTAWHARDYGLLAGNPFGRDKHAKFPDRKGKSETVKLKKGAHLKLRYGLFLHAGDVKEGKVKEAFEAFAGKK
jgi:hypothetical protein